ncbi:Asp-tRNA(Asn)/Glu-tRNA(Gln) amidotransferase subunit GatA [bacterium]|nr:MAG: Asp-tRNA(Asn)/Glu-tRNA(Gln) amidotransferase subunit GatA [bacterium]
MIKQLHNKLLNKEKSCTEIVQEYLDVIKNTNKKFNSFITVCEEEALKHAKEVDAKIARGESIGQLEGIPIAIKDNIVVKGIKTTAGSKILENYISPYDAHVIEKIKKAGMIIIGKTNCDSFGHGSGNENSDFGAVHNPWDLNRVPGGSSGGSAVAVTSNQCPIALGSDTGGSLRHPACWCGISALKPTYGRVSRNGLIAFASSTDVIGPMAQSVEDLSFIFEHLAGWDKNDASSVNIPIENYSQLEKKDLFGIKIGIPKEYFADGMDQNVRDAINVAIEKMKKLGAEVSEANLPHTKYAVACYYIIVSSETSTNLSRMDGIRFGKRSSNAKNLFETYTKSKAEGFHQETKRRIILGTFALSHGYYDAYYTKAQKIRELIKNDFKKEFEKFDCILAPVAPHPAYKIGEHSADPIKAYLEDMYLSASSLAGIPSLVMPCGLVKPKDGEKDLPIGFQLLGNWFDEKKLLEIGQAYEHVNM